MIVIATGGRYFTDREYVYRVLETINRKYPIEYGIHGGCQILDPETKSWINSGADWLFHDWCLDRDISVHIESGAPYFKKYGKRGGMLRNERMCEIGVSSMTALKISRIRCVAFKGGNGTTNMIENAIRHNIKAIKTWEMNWLCLN